MGGFPILPRCASVHGLSLHATTQVPAHRRDQLERLLRYMARGAVALGTQEEPWTRRGRERGALGGL